MATATKEIFNHLKILSLRELIIAMVCLKLMKEPREVFCLLFKNQEI